MSKMVAELPTPAILIDADRLEQNLRRMQAACDAAGVDLWPHIKTHKMVPILRRQLELGAKGATCAKLGEAEAMLPSGVRRIFLAHSLVDLRLAPRLRALHAALDELVLAVTSPRHCEALGHLLEAARIDVPVALAIDSGLGREGFRTVGEAEAVAAQIRRHPRMRLVALYTHEGHAYASSGVDERVAQVGGVIREFHRHLGLPVWPGCSVTASRLAGCKGVRMIRPGSYVFGDLALTETTGVMRTEDVALSLLSTVIDRPANDLALIDAGSKSFSSDKTPVGLFARSLDLPDLSLARLSEEHGFVTGASVGLLQVGRRLRWQVAHSCPAINLAAKVYLTRGEQIIDIWPVDARGRSD